MKNYQVEACVESLSEALIAEQRGADRIELCADLANDGLTPSFELMEEAASRLAVPVRVMIRPHARSFVYDDADMRHMREAISQCLSLRVEGVVLGMVEPSGRRLDLDQLAELVALAAPLKVTLHKAIDACDAPLDELGRIVQLGGIDAVLTSGKSATALDGAPLLREMIQLASNHVDIIACGKVTSANLESIHTLLGAKFYHGRKIVGSLA